YAPASLFDPNGAYFIGRFLEGGGGYLYGISNFGGTHGAGTFFRISHSGIFQKLHDFTGSERPNGSNTSPGNDGLMKASDGTFYYACASCGPTAGGAIFRYTLAGAVSTVASNFGAAGQGVGPYTRVLEASDGNLYGTTAGYINLGGGAEKSGTLYQLMPA